MKIIAKQEHDKYLVQMDKDELAKLLGHYSMYEVERKDINVREGAELRVSDYWDKIGQVERIISFNDSMVANYKNQIALIEKMKMPKFERPKK